MKKNLIKGIMYLSAIGLFFAIVCLSVCSTEQISEQVVESPEIIEIPIPEDTEAPEGILKTCFLVSSEEVLPSDFTENMSDESIFSEGFRTVELLCDDPTDFEVSEPKWSAEKDCYEEKGIYAENLLESFCPEVDGLYSMEVVSTDLYGNASVAKVYVLFVTDSQEPVWLENIQSETAKSESAVSNGFNRAKAEQAFAQVNQQRAANGVHELVWDESLYELACTRAQEITELFSHQRPDGGYVGDIIIRQYGAGGCGENIAENYESVTNLINGWLNSEEHKENMLNTRFTAGVMACYCHNGNYYWVNLFKQ